jgi:aspartokinase
LSTFGGAQSTVIVDDSVVEYSDVTEGGRPSIVGIASRPRLARVHSAEADAARAVAILDRLEDFDTFREVPSSNPGTLDVLVDMEHLPDPSASALALQERLSGLADVENDLSSVSAIADARAVEHLPSRVLQTLREAAVEVLSTYRHPLSVTCAVRAEQRRTAAQALHEALVGPRLQQTLAI